MKNRLLFYIFTAGIILNISGYYLGNVIKSYVDFLLFLDSTGTILAGVLLGPIVGAITGLTSNLILGVTDNLVNIPFALVNVVTGITSGIIASKYGFRTIKSLLFCTCSLTVLNSFFGAVVAYFLFGGITGAKLDLNMISFMDAGLLLSSFLVRIPVNFIDKAISSLIVFLMVMKLSDDKKKIAYAEDDN